jgi:hypothetical protein
MTLKRKTGKTEFTRLREQAGLTLGAERLVWRDSALRVLQCHISVRIMRAAENGTEREWREMLNIYCFLRVAGQPDHLLGVDQQGRRPTMYPKPSPTIAPVAAAA